MEFSREQIEYARQVPIQRLLGIQEGRRQAVRCVFHAERTPSLMVYPDNHYFCFGCSARGTGAIDFVVAMGYSFQDAVKQLIEL